MNKILKRKARLVAGYLAAGMTFAAATAQAAIDVTEVTGLLTEAATAVGAVGVAVLIVWGTRKAYNMVARG